MNDLVSLRERQIKPESLHTIDIEELIDLAAAKDKKLAECKCEVDMVKAEIQNRAENTLEERNIKFTEFFGDKNSFVTVTVAQAFEILNMTKIKEIIGKELVEEKVKVKQQDIKYDIDKKFQRALIAIATDDYSNEYSVEEIIDNADFEMNSSQRSLILKKLKGEYNSDKANICKILGKTDDELSIDEELYYIYKIKNWELIRAFFDTSNFEQLAKELKKYIAVDETPKIGLKYN